MKPRTTSYLMDEGGGRFFGPGPLDLLENVSRTSSLSAAAKAMGMSYTKAMRIVHKAERALGFPVTRRSIGGERGGSSELTYEGRELLRRYGVWSAAATQASSKAFEVAFAGMADVPKLGCVVMASGEARHFGRQKLLEPLCGQSVFARTLGALNSERLEVVVATRWDEVKQICEERGIAHASPSGPLQSDTVRCGIEALGRRAGYLFVQGDQPLLSAASVGALLDEFAAHPHAIVRLCWRGRQGSPVVFPQELAGALQALDGDVGGGEILRRNPAMASYVRCVEAAQAVELDDIDTPGDLDRMEKLYRGAHTGESLS